jgi:tetratricopeptide (TPR) repeat protein
VGITMKTIKPLLIVLVTFTANVWGLEKLQVGMNVPNFALPDLEGNQVSLADFRDRDLVVVTFFATWSVNAAELLERLELLSRRYEGKQLTVLGLNVERQNISPGDEEAIRRVVGNLRLSFPILLDRGLETFRNYGVVAVPSTLVIDRTGMIIGELAGYPIALREDLFDLIEAKLSKVDRNGKAEQKRYAPELKAVRYYNLARVLIDRGSVDMAVVTLKNAIDSDHGFPLPLILLGQLYVGQSMIDESVEFQGRTFQTVLFSPAERQQFLTEATELFQQALALDPRNSTALTELANLSMKQGQRSNAEKLLHKALQGNPSFTPAHCAMGELLLRKGRIKKAQRAFETVTELNPLDYRCYLVFAQAYEAKEMLEQAVTLYKKGLELLWLSRIKRLPLSLSHQEE